jgi:hypothetical protein
MEQTAVEWLVDILLHKVQLTEIEKMYIEHAKEMEKNNTDNKVIHFAEWLTKKHTTTLITLYEHFEEQYYNENFKSE